MKNFSISFLFAVLIMIGSVSCHKSKDGQVSSRSGDHRPVVLAVNYPLYEMAHKIAGELIEIQMPFPDDVDPAYWQPKDSQISKIQQADLILLSGGGYANWANFLDLDDSKLVNCAVEFEQNLIEMDSVFTHSHGPSGAHTHRKVDFNVWLNPEYLQYQAAEIAEAFATLLPEKKDQFAKGLSNIQEDFEVLQEAAGDLAQLLAEKRGKLVLEASHPVYGYLAQLLDVDMHSFHWEPEETPPVEQMTSFLLQTKKAAAKGMVTLMLWEGDPMDSILASLDQPALVTVVFYPCGNRVAGKGYFAVMEENFRRLYQSVDKI